MNFLNIGAAFFALVLPIIVLMYLLKLKRTRVVLSSTMLWRKSVADLVANAPFQKLRRNLLLYLQLLIAALIVLALMRPLVRMQGAAGKKYIVLIDRSASMKALAPSGRTRFQEAVTHAETLINEMAKGDTLTLISFSNRTDIEQNKTADKELLLSALRRIKPIDTATDINEALIIADSLARPEYEQGGEVIDDKQAASYDPRARIVIISDGCFGAKSLRLARTETINFLQVGKTADDPGDANVGITAMDISLGLDGTASPVVFAGVTNFGPAPIERLLTLYVDDVQTDVKSVKLEKHGEDTFRFKPFGERGENVTTATLATPHAIRLELGPYDNATESFDALSVDDRAYGILMPPRPLKILIATEGNFFLEQLLGLIPNTRTVKTAPEKYQPTDEYDITIFDNYSPEKLPTGNFLFLHAAPRLPGFEVGEKEIARPSVMDWNRVHLLTRFVSFEGLYLDRALDLKPPLWASVLVESPTHPLVLSFEREGIRGVIVTFDFYSSDWALRPSFPIFISNVIRWLSVASNIQEQPVLRTGTILPLQPKKKIDTFTIVDPAGKLHLIEIDDGKIYPFTATDQIGFYRLSSSGAEKKEERRLAFNLLSIEESRIAPPQNIKIGSDIVTANTGILTANREIWQWLLWAALLILVIEWLIYCRRTWT